MQLHAKILNTNACIYSTFLHYNQRATRSYFSGATNDDGAYRRNAISNVSKTSADSLHFVIYINNWMYWIEPVVRWHFTEVVHRRPKSVSTNLMNDLSIWLFKNDEKLINSIELNERKEPIISLGRIKIKQLIWFVTLISAWLTSPEKWILNEKYHSVLWIEHNSFLFLEKWMPRIIFTMFHICIWSSLNSWNEFNVTSETRNDISSSCLRTSFLRFLIK